MLYSSNPPLLFSSSLRRAGRGAEGSVKNLMNTIVTTEAGWEKFTDTGDNSFLGDVRPEDVVSGASFVISGEGWERTVIIK